MAGIHTAFDAMSAHQKAMLSPLFGIIFDYWVETEVCSSLTLQGIFSHQGDLQ